MSSDVVLLDYGIGNLLSVRRALEACGARLRQTDDPDEAARAERLVVPGVGAFGDCVSEVRRRAMDEAIVAFAATGRPLLGICVGMQMLLEMGDEFGEWKGLGLIPGRVRQIDPCGADGSPHKIPHIGWGRLLVPEEGRWDGTALANTPELTAFYFVHSFAAEPSRATDRWAEVDYDGLRLCAAVRHENVCGTQFHPEKSGPAGLAFLRGFLAQ